MSAVNVSVEMAAEDQTARVPEIAEFARDLAAKVEERFPGIDVRLVGTVMVNQVFTEASVSSQMIFLPVSMAIMALVFAALTRRFSGVMATGFVICSSMAAAMGLGGWAGLPLSAPTAPAPTIVLMIVVANCVHLMVTLLQRMQAGDSKDAAIIESVRVNLYPVFLASATTALGFLAMNFSEVPPHRHLGTFVAFGIIASFLLSVTFLPALLSVMPMPAPKKAGRSHDPLMGAIAEFVVRRRWFLLFGSAVVVLGLLAAVPRNDLNDVLVHFFDESVEFRQDTDFLDERLSGNTVLEYSLASAGPDEISDPVYLAEVSAFAEWYRAQPEVRHVAVITDTFRQASAARCDVAVSTAFRWRHRFLAAARSDSEVLKGIVEANETYVLESRKGARGLGRKARRRGGKAKKRGLSREQVPALMAADRSGTTVSAVLPRVDAAALAAALDPVVAKDALLASDGGASYPPCAAALGVSHEALNRSMGERVRGDLHVQTVNSRHSRLKDFLRPRRGIATRYLDNYLSWFHLVGLAPGANDRACLAASVTR